MSAPTPSISRSEFEALLARNGAKPVAADMDELYAIYAYVEGLKEMVRKPFGYDAEPAHVFDLTRPTFVPSTRS